MSASQPVVEPRGEHSDWLSSEELAELTPEVLVERVEALKPLIVAHAKEVEENRRPADEVIEALRKAGVFYHFVPKKYGGLELGLTDLVNVVLPIGEACTSTAWVVSFCIQHNFLTAQLPQAGQDEIFGISPYTIAPGTGAPPAQVSRVPGGYKVSGHIRYASGVVHSDWVQVVGAMPEEDGSVTAKFLMMPTSDVKILDTWFVDGLAGTGSHDILLDDVFVPEARAVNFDDLISGNGVGSKIYDNPLFKVPVDVLLNISSSAPGIGAARGMVKFFRESIRKKATKGPDGQPNHKLTSVMRLAEAELAAHTAETLLRQATSETEAAVSEGRVLGPEDRIRIRSRIGYAVHLARQAGRIIMDGAGTSAHQLGNPLQRQMRDLEVMASHRVYEKDTAMETWGKVYTDSASASAIKHHHSAAGAQPSESAKAAAASSQAV